MSTHRVLPWLACGLLSFVLGGCGGQKTVTINRDPPDAAGGASSLQGSSLDVPRSNGTTREASANGGETETADSSTSSRPADGTVTIVDAKPTGTGETGTTDSSTGDTSTNNPSTTTDVPAAVVETIPPSNYQVTLASGQTLDIKALLEAERAAFEKKLEGVQNSKSLLRTYYESESESKQGSGNGAETPGRPVSGRFSARGKQQQPTVDMSKPFLWIGRIAGTLRGPTVAYYPDNTPMIYVAYDRDSRRDGTLISWDELGRPVVLDQFVSGRRHGLRVLFRTLGDNDPTGRVALLQEWQRGKSAATHLVTAEDKVLSFEAAAVSTDPNNDELADALAELDEFDKSLSENEAELRKAVAELHRNEVMLAKALKSAARAQAQAAAFQAQRQIIGALRSGLQSPGNFRSNYGNYRSRRRNR